MDTVRHPTHHNLNGKWNLYYHLPNNTKWDLSSYSRVASSIDTLENVVRVNEKLTDNVVKNCMLFVMRDGISPMWEDPKNREGGSFSYKISNKLVPDIWKHLFYLLCGESLCTNKDYNQYVNGITISPKKNFCIIKIWLSVCEYQDPDMIVDIPNLPKHGCLFKAHQPEF